MIRGRFSLAPDGGIQSFQVGGHQSVGKGELALFCAVVSASVRSFVRVCEQDVIPSQVQAREEGVVSFEIEGAIPNRERYSGMSSVLLQTFRDLSRENSAIIEFTEIVKDDETGGWHGNK